MSLKSATTLVIVCLSINLILGFTIRALMPYFSTLSTSSFWFKNMYSFLFMIQMILLNGSLIIFFVVLRLKQK